MTIFNSGHLSGEYHHCSEMSFVQPRKAHGPILREQLFVFDGPRVGPISVVPLPVGATIKIEFLGCTVGMAYHKHEERADTDQEDAGFFHIHHRRG